MKGGGEGALCFWPDAKCVRGFDRAGATINNLSSISVPLKAPSDPEKERTSRRARYRADPEKRQRYCHSPEHASRSAKRVKVTQRYVVPLQPLSYQDGLLNMLYGS